MTVDARADFCAEHLGPLTRSLDLFVRDASLGEELAQLDRPAAWLYRVRTNLGRSRARRAKALTRALVLRHVGGLTVAETAELLGVPGGRSPRAHRGEPLRSARHWRSDERRRAVRPAAGCRG